MNTTETDTIIRLLKVCNTVIEKLNAESEVGGEVLYELETARSVVIGLLDDQLEKAEEKRSKSRLALESSWSLFVPEADKSDGPLFEEEISEPNDPEADESEYTVAGLLPPGQYEMPA